MPGILIDNGDGYPLELTSGIRFLKFCGICPAGKAVYVPFTSDNSAIANVDNTISGVVAGQPTYFIPTGDTWFHDTVIKKTFLYDVSAPANNVFRQSAKAYNNTNDGLGARFETRRGYVLQIDRSNASQGILLADSSDFVNINDTSVLTHCSWSGWITTQDGKYNIAQRFGECAVFAKWSDTGTFGVEFDGTYIYTYGNDLPYGDDRPVNARLHVVIFKRGSIPNPGNFGLAMWNANGQCVFSSNSKPFIHAGDIRPANGGNVGSNYIALGQYGLGNYTFNGHMFTCTLGLTRNGNTLGIGGNRRIESERYYGSRDPMYFKFQGMLPMIKDIFPK